MKFGGYVVKFNCPFGDRKEDIMVLRDNLETIVRFLPIEIPVKLNDSTDLKPPNFPIALAKPKIDDIGIYVIYEIYESSKDSYVIPIITENMVKQGIQCFCEYLPEKQNGFRIVNSIWNPTIILSPYCVHKINILDDYL